MRTLLPGLLLSIAIALAAMVGGAHLPGLGSICLAILAGMAAGNLLPNQKLIAPGTGFAEQRILPVAIALMGTELELHTLGSLGLPALAIVLPAMAASILLALLLGRYLGLSKPASLVLGIGNSVCGSSAVLASAPAARADAEDVASAIAAVNLLGTLGMFLLPAVALGLGLHTRSTAYLLGGSLQSVGQVAAAGFAVSHQVGQSALVIKMLRVLMIGPIVMGLHWFLQPGTGKGAGRRLYVPGYIIGFLVCAFLAASFPGDTVVLPRVEALAKFLLTVAMAAVGCRINFRALLSQGPRSLLLVTLLSIFQAATVLALTRLIA